MEAQRTPGPMLYVPFKYDLGGSIADIQRLMTVLAEQHDGVTIDRALLHASNPAYLAGHAPTVSCGLHAGSVYLAGADWHYESRLRVYPRLGVASVDYTLTLEQGTPEPARFFDDLIEWKDRDYLPYLRECHAITDNLSRQIPVDQATAALDLHGSAVRALRHAVSNIVEPRPFLYPFHDFILCFVGGAEDLPDERTLLWFSASATSEIESPDPLRFKGIDITASSVSTVIRGEHAKNSSEVEPIIMLLSLIHAQWYVCLLWINGYDLPRQGPAIAGEPADAHVLSANQSALARDLSEVDNLNLMLRDPGLLRIARYLEAHLDVRRHRETAMSLLRVLENHSRQLADYNSETELRRFQALFAISAAAGVASLVPALAQVGFSMAHVVTTIIPLFTLWGLFAINFAAVRQRWKTRRQRRP